MCVCVCVCVWLLSLPPPPPGAVDDSLLEPPMRRQKSGRRTGVRGELADSDVLQSSSDPNLLTFLDHQPRLKTAVSTRSCTFAVDTPSILIVIMHGVMYVHMYILALYCVPFIPFLLLLLLLLFLLSPLLSLFLPFSLLTPPPPPRLLSYTFSHSFPVFSLPILFFLSPLATGKGSGQGSQAATS